MIDEEKVIAGFKLVMEGLGLDLNSSHFRDSPQRVAKAWTEELCIGLKEEAFKLTTFPIEDNYFPSMVVLQHIPVKSICAHHLLPFVGEATVAYLPNKSLCGLSKLSRVVNFLARKPQVQELLTNEIADYLENALAPQGVGVIIQASHLCMELRGVNHSGIMTTSALRGIFLADPAVRKEFLSLALSAKSMPYSTMM